MLKNQEQISFLIVRSATISTLLSTDSKDGIHITRIKAKRIMRVVSCME